MPGAPVKASSNGWLHGGAGDRAMKALVIGGGPAGLYAACLLKRRRLAGSVTVIEQNPSDATYGFGVVFSETARNHLSEADPATHEALLAASETWDDLTIVHRGERVAIDGNGFSALSRLELLRILQEQCDREGVDIRFGQQVRALPAADEADLVIGADGVNSTVRTLCRETSRPTIHELSNRFAWYGTAKPFETLTLTFREHAGGHYVAHHYRYSPTMSTFIVECDAATWEQAGLARMSDAESRARCETVFAADLNGWPLISNKSVWRRFPVLVTERWAYRNMVLLGDASKTIHFSIGSGTRLAMEDALALTHALEEEKGCVEDALQRFESERRPAVDRLLSAAGGSYRWYEEFPARMHLAPHAFAHSYMTRSGRVDDERLAAIAPSFMAAYRAKVAAEANRR